MCMCVYIYIYICLSTNINLNHIIITSRSAAQIGAGHIKQLVVIIISLLVFLFYYGIIRILVFSCYFSLFYDL